MVHRDGALQQPPAKHHQRHPAPMGEQEEGSGVRGELSPHFPLGRNEAPAVKEALKKGGMEARQDHGKL